MKLAPYRRHDPIQQILGRVRYAGMRWEVEDGELYLTGRTENLTDDHRRDIDKHRAGIVAALESLPEDCPTPHMCFDLGPCCAGASCAQAAPDHETTTPADFAGYAAYTRDLTDDDDAYELTPADVAEAETVGEEMRADATLKADVFARLAQLLATPNADARTVAQLQHAIAAYLQAREAAS